MKTVHLKSRMIVRRNAQRETAFKSDAELEQFILAVIQKYLRTHAPLSQAIRDLIRAGQILNIEVMDHCIMGCATPDRPKDYSSLRELGYFFDSLVPTTPKPARRCRKKSKARR